MNTIRQIEKLNQQELDSGTSIEGSWHNDYKDTSYIYIGGLGYELTEGDVISIFSQYGNPVHVKLARDKESGKSKGFGWLKYEDQRSTILAVDNFNGSEIVGRRIRVDHAYYKPVAGEEDEEEKEIEKLRKELIEAGGREVKREGGDEVDSREKRVEVSGEIEDPMANYLKEKEKEKENDRRRKRGRDDDRHRDRHRDRNRDRNRDRDSDRDRGSGSGSGRERYSHDRKRESRDRDDSEDVVKDRYRERDRSSERASRRYHERSDDRHRHRERGRDRDDGRDRHSHSHSDRSRDEKSEGTYRNRGCKRV